VPGCVGAIRGTGTALRYTPGPPSIDVFSTIVASTKVTASVSNANSSPRTARTRNTTAPSARPSAVATAAATGSVARNGQSNLPASTAVA
jgi:hypothetical protein